MKKAVTLVAVSVFIKIYRKMQSKKGTLEKVFANHELICDVFPRFNTYKEANVKV